MQLTDALFYSFLILLIEFLHRCLIYCLEMPAAPCEWLRNQYWPNKAALGVGLFMLHFFSFTLCELLHNLTTFMHVFLVEEKGKPWCFLDTVVVLFMH